MAREPHPDFARLLDTDLSESPLEVFAVEMEEILLEATTRQAEWGLTRQDLKLLVRRLGLRFGERSGHEAFAAGAYFPFFAWTCGTDDEGRSHLRSVLQELAGLHAILDLDASLAQASTGQVITTWGWALREGSPLGRGPATQLLLWRTVESLVKGVLEVHPVKAGPWTGHYPVFAAPKDLARRRKNPRRAELLEELRFTLECTSLARPSLARLIEAETGSAPKMPRAEPISVLIRHQAEIIALAETDLIEPLLRIIEAFLGHLVEHVLPGAKRDDLIALVPYLTVLRDRYLPALTAYCYALRQSRRESPFLGDLLIEPYLIRTKALDGDREPSLGRLLQDWRAVQVSLERRAGFRGQPAFSFERTGHQTLHAIGLVPPTPSPGEHDPAAVAAAKGRTSQGMPVVAIHQFNTLIGIDAYVPPKPPPIPTDARAPRKRLPTPIVPLAAAELALVEATEVDDDQIIFLEDIESDTKERVDLHKLATMILPAFPGPIGRDNDDDNRG